MRRLYTFILILSLTNLCHALNCYFTAKKGSCWSDYNVNVDVVDAKTGKKLTSLSMLQGQLWDRQKITCTPSQTFDFKSSYYPSIWDGDSDKIFLAKHFLQLPETTGKKGSAWDLTICFPDGFAQVPTSPAYNSNCTCDKVSVPPVTLN